MQREKDSRVESQPPAAGGDARLPVSHERWKTADEIANGSQHAAPNKFVAVEERREKRARLGLLALICAVIVAICLAIGFGG